MRYAPTDGVSSVPVKELLVESSGWIRLARGGEFELEVSAAGLIR
jgi:hypothetical protein